MSLKGVEHRDDDGTSGTTGAGSWEKLQAVKVSRVVTNCLSRSRETCRWEKPSYLGESPDTPLLLEFAERVVKRLSWALGTHSG